MISKITFVWLSLILLAGCSPLGVARQPYDYTELALMPGDSIIARTNAGTITIHADDALKRTYTWDGESRSVRLWPRKSRWYGSLGAYYPGAGSHWAPVNGITRGVLQEGQMHFSSTQAALDWLNSPWHEKAGAVYSDDGLFVLFSKDRSRNQVNVDVFQVYVDGDKPTRLAGSSDRAITFQNN